MTPSDDDKIIHRRLTALTMGYDMATGGIFWIQLQTINGTFPALLSKHSINISPTKATPGIELSLLIEVRNGSNTARFVFAELMEKPIDSIVYFE